MTQNGKVTDVFDDLAKVVVIRRSACDGCKQKNLCAGISEGCSDGKPVEAVVKNSAGAKVGDDVILESPGGYVLGMTFAVFVLPILIAFVAFAVVSAFFEQWIAYTASGILFAVSVGFLCFYLNRRVKKNPGIEIVKIIKKENTEL